MASQTNGRNVTVRRSFWTRIVSLLLALSYMFTFVALSDVALGLTAHAEDTTTEGSDFNIYTYIADQLLDTDYYIGHIYNMEKTINKSSAEIIVDSMDEKFYNTVLAWEVTNLALSPQDIPQKAIDAKGYYMTVLLSMLQCSYQSETVFDSLSFVKDVKGVTSIYNNFAKMYKEVTKSDLTERLNDTYNGVFSDSLKQELIDVQIKYLEEDFKDNKFIRVGSAASDIFTVLDICTTPQQYVDSFVNYCQVMQTTYEWRQCIEYMYNNCDRSNTALYEALLALNNMTDDWASVALEIWRDGVADVVQEGLSFGIDKFVDTFISDVGGTIAPLIKGFQIGQAIGRNLSNMLFGTDATIEQFYILTAYCDVYQLFRKALANAETEYLNNKTPENARILLNYVGMYFDTIKIGNDYGKDYADVIYHGGLVNWLIRSEGEYQSYINSIDRLQKSTDLDREFINIFWLHELYYDDPDLYAVYADIVKKEYSDFNAWVSEIAFENESVEWGINDYEFSGHDCYVYPDSANNKNIIYTTSDKSVAEITNSGTARVYGIGTCVITATAADNEELTDTLIVNVIEGNGANSVAFPDIIPIQPNPDVVDSDFTYIINDDDTLTITGYKGSDTDIEIPNTIGGRLVTAIGEKAFFEQYVNKSQLNSIILPDSVITIGKSAFENCCELTDITMPSSVTTICDSAFDHCVNLENIAIPDSVIFIGDRAFSYCRSLTNIIIPNSVNFIGEFAFCHCDNLISINIPTSVTSIGNSVFSYCKSLSNITIPDNIMSIGDNAFSYCESLATLNISSNVTSIGDSAFSHCESLITLNIPNSVSYIGDSAFYYCNNLTSVAIPDNVTSIGNSTFYHCKNLINITIPNSIMSIGDEAFYDCDSLTNITIPDSVTSIGDSTFSNCDNLTCLIIPDSVVSMGVWSFGWHDKLETIVLPRCVTSIGDYAFSGCTGLTSIIIPNSVTSIGNDAFSGCDSLTSITLPDSVASIGNNAFRYCYSLTNITIPDSVTLIGDDVFSNCGSLTSLIIPNSVISIGEWSFSGYKNLETVVLPECINIIGDNAFKDCSKLSHITIPNGVTFIGDSAFYDCDSLTGITFPDSVTSIGNSAFSGCDSLTSITLPDSVTSIGNSAFSGCVNLPSITIPVGVTSISDNTFHLCHSLTNVSIPDNVTIIGDNALGCCCSLTSITIPNCVTVIGNNAFEYCDSLTQITIPDSVTSIGNSAFYGCENLTNITFPNSVTSIGDSAFYGCENLTNITLPNSVTSIKNKTFYNCLNLKSINIPESVTSIGDKAFRLCSLTSLTIPKSVITIGDNAFLDCYHLTSITIPDSVTSMGIWQCHSFRDLENIVLPNCITSIEASAFYDCNSLKSITIPNYVTSIGDEAFKWCDNLTSIIIPSSVTSIGNSTFSGCDILTIYGYTGSYAQTYAYEHDIPFVCLDGNEQIITIPQNVTVTCTEVILNNGDLVTTGDTLHITANIPDGYNLKSLKVNGVDIENGGKYVVGEENVIITVEFEEIIPVVPDEPVAYIITIPDGVTVTRSDVSLASGDTVSTDDTLHITANIPDGYNLKSLKVNGVDIENGGKYVVGEEDVVITVEFEEITDEPDPFITGISMNAVPKKTSYYIGDAIDLTGATLRISYSDGESEIIDVTADMVSGFDSSSVGTKTITVTYDDFTTSFNVTVRKKSSGGGGGTGGGSSSNIPVVDTSYPIVNGEEMNWLKISDEINKPNPGDTIYVDLNGDIKIPAFIFMDLNDNLVTMNAKFNDEFTWVIDGSKTGTPEDSALLVVRTTGVYIPGVLLDKVQGEMTNKFHIDETVENIELSVSVGKEHNGLFANLYRYNSDTYELDFVAVAAVDNNGNALIPADIAGDYVIMVDEYSALPGDVDNNGVLDIDDAMAILQYILDIISLPQIDKADYNQDDIINALDAAAILKELDKNE